MAHEDHAPGQGIDERLESLQTGEVEVVGGLVEEEHVVTTEQDGDQRRACRFTSRQDAHRRVEQAGRETDVVTGRAGARVEVGSTHREVGVEGSRVRIGAVVGRVRQRGGGPFQFRLGRGHAGPAGQVREHGFVATLGFLRQVAHLQCGRRDGDRAAIGAFESGEQAQQRGLAHTVGPDHAQPRARSDRHVDPVEHGVGAVLAREVTSDEREGREGGTTKKVSRGKAC